MEESLNQDKLRDKKLDVLLVIPPPLWTKMPNLGVAYLATFLKSNGIKAGVYDFNLKLYNSAPPELKSYWQIDCLNSFFVTEVSNKILFHFRNQIETFVEEVLSTGIQIIGFSVNIVSIFLANEIAGMIKLKDNRRTIIFGGPAGFFKSHRKLLGSCFVDIFVIGEGEATLLNILNNFKKGKKLKNKPGVLLGRYYNRLDISPAKPIEDLDSIPFPDFKEFNLDEYNLGIQINGYDYKPIPLLLSRGCIGRCSYCIDYIMWPGFRYRSAESVISEIEYHINMNRTRAFEFNDLTCNGNLKQLSRLCDLIIDSGLKFNWVSYAIIRKDMDEELFFKLKRSGCNTLIYGLESASDNILRKMRKTYTSKDAEEIIKRTHAAGICTNINIIAGFPRETEEDFNETISFLYRNKEHIDQVTNISGFTLFPDSEIGRFKSRYGVVWQEGTDPMLFRDTTGLDRQGRRNRVERMSQVLDELNIHNTIINKPKLNPVVAEK